DEVVLLGGKHANHRYRGGTDLIRPATRATYRGPTGPISLKTVHWTVFRALDAPEGEGFGVRQPPFLLLIPYCLLPCYQRDKSVFITERLLLFFDFC
ncbi:MAG: hypothetical protein IJ089_11965, partial [Clostridia bacterium]|nr:hypothetical protein [Clostridia bacterium]